MTRPDTPIRIQWDHQTVNREPIVQTMTTDFAGVQYRVSVETTGRRTACRRLLDSEQNTTPIGDWYVTTESAVNACIEDMGLERHEVAVSFRDAGTGRKIEVEA